MIVVSITKDYKQGAFPASSIQRIAEFVCHKENVNNAELSFVLINDRTIRAINRKFLKHDYVTDVITFPLEMNEVNAEIYVNGEQAKRQAKENNVSLKNEMMRLVVHGTLHAIGYDDTTSAKKKRMESIQERYVAELSSKQ